MRAVKSAMEKGAKKPEGVRWGDLLRRLHDAEQRCARRKQSRAAAIAMRAKRAERLIGLADQFFPFWADLEVKL